MRVTDEESVVTTLPTASSTLTAGWVVKFVPSVTPPTGWVVNASLLAVPGVMLKAALTAEVSELSVAVRV